MPPGMIMPRDNPAERCKRWPPYIHAGWAKDSASERGATSFRAQVGVNIFHLEISVIRWQILPRAAVDAFAYNGQIPGPRLRVTEGDHVRIIVHCQLPETTTIHWHGLILPNNMDGPAFITQDPIRSGGSYAYEFTADQAGTFFYHSHDHPDRQQALAHSGRHAG